MKVSFIGVGVPRAATTWLFECLKEHPQLYLPFEKELHYFNEQDVFDGKSKYDLEGIEGYFKRFGDSKGLKAGEISPTYIISNKARKTIKKHFPDVKIIVCLREPKSRYISEYLLSINFVGSIVTPKMLRRMKELGFYYEYLRKWIKDFGKKNVFILLVDDIETNPGEVIKDLYDFLGVDKNFLPSKLNQRVWKYGEARFTFLLKLRRGISNLGIYLRKNYFGFLVDLGKWLKINRMFYFLLRTNKKDNIKKETSQVPGLDELDYTKDIEKLEILLKRDLIEWKLK